MSSSTSSELRKLAENRLREKSTELDLSRPIEDVHRLVHELEVHQIELKMQNEELRQIRDVLDASLEKYTDLFDFAPIGYFTLNSKGEIAVLNLTGSALLGMERSLLIGRNFCQFIAPEDQQVFSDFIVNTFNSQTRQSCEISLTIKSKPPLYVHIEGLSNQLSLECRMIITDISALKNSEKSLRESEKLYRAIGEANKYGIWVCNPEGQNIYASESFLKMVGITQEQCSGFGWGDVLHPDDVEQTIAAWKECVKTEGNWDIEHRYRGIDGKWHPILARGVPVRDDNGKIIYWAGINLDISQIKQTQQDLLKSQDLSSKTLQAISAHIAVIDSHGTIIAVNNAWESFAAVNGAGGSSKVAIGSNYCEVCRKAANDNDTDAAAAISGIELILNGTLKQFTLEYPCHSTELQRWFLMTVVPLGLRAENGAVITHQDITTRKEAEILLKMSNEILDSKIIERTSELTDTNSVLLKEIDNRIQAEESLKTAYLEIKQLKNKLLAENIYLQQEVARLDNFGEIIGQSSAISYVFSQIQQVAPINATVLLLGETGTGKGMVAGAIHRGSLRKNKPMITVNCTALPGNLIESELFGREKGAFTGATERQMGRFELADGGTIFLDEIGEMPMDLQCKLLRVIQDGEFERLGSPRTIKVDVRIIAATNRNLEEEIRKGKFREDLFYRLNVFPISIPPLNQRIEDIPLLINHFVSKFNKKIGKNIDSIPKETVEILSKYSWPGNIRELENVIERSVITTNGSILQVLDRFDMSLKKEEQTDQEVKGLIELEKAHILQVLQKTGWRIEGKNGAAIILGLNASTLRARMRKYGILRQ